MKISDTVVGAGFVAAGALIIAGTLNYPTLDAGHPGPSLFPRILGGLMAVFGGLVSLKALRTGDATQDVEWLLLHKSTGFINAVFVLVGVTAYILFVERLGFTLGNPRTQSAQAVAILARERITVLLVAWQVFSYWMERS